MKELGLGNVNFVEVELANYLSTNSSFKYISQMNLNGHPKKCIKKY